MKSLQILVHNEIIINGLKILLRHGLLMKNRS